MNNQDNELFELDEILEKFNFDVGLTELEVEAGSQAILDWHNKQVEKEIRPIVDAFTIKGIYPPYHDEQVAHLEKHWPVLYRAIVQLVNLNKLKGSKNDQL